MKKKQRRRMKNKNKVILLPLSHSTHSLSFPIPPPSLYAAHGQQLCCPIPTATHPLGVGGGDGVPPSLHGECLGGVLEIDFQPILSKFKASKPIKIHEILIPISDHFSQ